MQPCGGVVIVDIQVANAGGCDVEEGVTWLLSACPLSPCLTLLAVQLSVFHSVRSGLLFSDCRRFWRPSRTTKRAW